MKYQEDFLETLRFKQEHFSDAPRLYSIIAAAELDIFSMLDNREGISVAEISGRKGWDPRGLKLLLDSLVVYGWLERKGNCQAEEAGVRDDVQYFIKDDPVLWRLLRSDSKESILGYLEHLKRIMNRWLYIAETIKTGEPPFKKKKKKITDKKLFAEAMKGTAQGVAELTAETIKPFLVKTETLLELGCGPGEYARAFLDAAPNLHIRLVDNRETLNFAKANLMTEKGFKETRVSFHELDVLKNRLPDNNELIFSSNVLHIFSISQNRFFLKNAYRSLINGGILILKDFFFSDYLPEYLSLKKDVLYDDRFIDQYSAWFSLNMLTGRGGRSYGRGEISEILFKLGMKNITWKPLLAKDKKGIITLASSLIWAEK